MDKELIKSLAGYGPFVLLGGVFIWNLPALMREYLSHRREMAKIVGDERRKEQKFSQQIEAARQKRLVKPGARKR